MACEMQLETHRMVLVEIVSVGAVRCAPARQRWTLTVTRAATHQEVHVLQATDARFELLGTSLR